MLGNFSKKLDFLTKVRLLVSTLFLVAGLVLFNSASQYLPSIMSVTLGQWHTGSFKVYLGTGKGFNEAESYHHQFTRKAGEQSKLYFLLPSEKFQRLRIDPGSQKGKVSINDICLHSVSGTKCWSPQNIEEETSNLEFTEQTEGGITTQRLVLSLENGQDLFDGIIEGTEQRRRTGR